MQPAVVRILVSSTWLDLQPERAAVEHLLQRFREAKFVGMEYFGSRDETTRAASLAEVERCDLYLGIIGGRYGSGITEAEYDAARARSLRCFIYFKQEPTIPVEARDSEPERRDQLARFKTKLTHPETGHIVSEFAGPYELASLVAADLHNWLFEHYMLPALASAEGKAGGEQVNLLREDLAGFMSVQRELLCQVSAERRRSEGQRRVALDAFYELTYEVPSLLGTTEQRAGLVRRSIGYLEQLTALNLDDHQVLRELATNWRLLGTTLNEASDWTGALTAFQKSGVYCARLLELAPDEALYHHDDATSHFNAGYVLEQLGRWAAALEEYEVALPAARRAAELDAQWKGLENDTMARIRALQ